ncbi:hypothetical protein [Streptomyces sp. NPDC055134]
MADALILPATRLRRPEERAALQMQFITLSDKPGFQTFPVGISDVTTIRLTLAPPPD